MMKVIILAGGLGTRLRSVMPDIPKPMAPVHGRPFLDYQLDYWVSQGVSGFVLSVGYKHEVIETHFGTSYQNVPIEYVVEDRPLGTGGALLLAVGSLAQEQTFILSNGDTYFEVDLQAMLDFHRQKRAALTMALRKVAANARYGEVQLNRDSRISGFDGPSGTPGETHINGGIYLMERTLLDSGVDTRGNPLSLEGELLPSFIASGYRCYGIPFSGKFVDIGVPSDYFEVAPSILA